MPFWCKSVNTERIIATWKSYIYHWYAINSSGSIRRNIEFPLGGISLSWWGNVSGHPSFRISEIFWSPGQSSITFCSQAGWVKIYTGGSLYSPQLPYLKYSILLIFLSFSFDIINKKWENVAYKKNAGHSLLTLSVPGMTPYGVMKQFYMALAPRGLIKRCFLSKN